ncbi:MAG: hypothetical protein RLP15_03470 [Cryomorphaceae bacterium]
MKRIITLLTVLTLVLSVTSCKKRKAEKTLRGSWVITYIGIDLDNSCESGTEYFTNSDGAFGEANFEKKTFTMTYAVDFDAYPSFTPSCYEGKSAAIAGDWDVTEHDRQLLVLHSYTVELAGQNWTAEFYTDTFGSNAKAKEGVEDVVLSRTLPNGGEVYLEMAKLN